MRPLFAYVVVEKEKLKSSSIIVPKEAAARHAQPYGVLTAAGPNCSDDVKALVGKTVLFKRHSGDWLKDPKGEEFYVIHEEDILAVQEN